MDMAILQKYPESFDSVLDISEYGRNFRRPSIPFSNIFLLKVDVWAWNDGSVGINMVRTANINTQKSLVFSVAKQKRVLVLPNFTAAVDKYGKAVFF